MATFSPNSAKAAGSQADDGYRFGRIHKNQYLIDTYGTGTAATAGVITAALGAPGVYYTPMTTFNIQPLTAAANNIAAAQIAANAGYLTLATAAPIAATNNLITGVTLDCQRGLTITGNANTAAANYVVYGLDNYLNAVGEQITGPVGANTTTSVKTYRYVTAIHVSAGTVANVEVGTGDVFGLPYYLPSLTNGNAPTAATTRADLVVSPYWNNLPISFTINGNGALAASTAIVGGDARTATNATLDVRGTVTPPSASDGTKWLALHLMVAAAVPPQSNALLLSTSTSFLSYFGQPQFIPPLL